MRNVTANAVHVVNAFTQNCENTNVPGNSSLNIVINCSLFHWPLVFEFYFVFAGTRSVYRTGTVFGSYEIRNKFSRGKPTYARDSLKMSIIPTAFLIQRG